MKSSIYISSEKIEVIGYTKSDTKVWIKEYTSYPLPEETVINGKIIDPGPLVEGLKSIKNQNPGLFENSILIVDGSSIFSKRITAPKLKKWQYIRLIRDEFAEIAENPEDLICDFHSVAAVDGSAGSILIYAMEKAQFDTYMAVFNNAGIKLEKIKVGVQSVLKCIEKMPQLHDMTFVLNIIDGITMLSMIFQNGVNIFISRTRLYGDDIETLNRNILGSLSGFTQFNKSQNFNDITHSFYLGLNDVAFEKLCYDNPYPNMQFDKLAVYQNVQGAEKLPESAHFAYLNTLLEDNSIDFIRCRKELETIKRKMKPKNIWIPIFSGTTAVFIIPAVILLFLTIGVNKDIDEIKEYLERPDIIESSKKIDEILKQTTRIDNILNQLKQKNEWDAGRTRISREVLDLITQTRDDKVDITNFSFREADETINVSGSSNTENDSRLYVETLKSNALISDVTYSGFSYDNQGRYNFAIKIKTTAVAQKEGTKNE